MTNGLRKRGPKPGSPKPGTGTGTERAPEEVSQEACSDPHRGAEDYGVGFGKPPGHTKFKPGQSGNPKGRPKGRKNLRRIFQEVVFKKVRVTENGRTRGVPAIQAVLLGQLKSALAGDHRAADKMIRLIPQVSAILAEEATADATTAPPRQNDTEVLEEFARMIREADAMEEGGSDD